MEIQPPRKWTAKRIAVLACGIGILVLCGWRMFQDLTKDPDSRYMYPVIFTIAAISIIAITKSSSRAFIVRNSKTVVRVGRAIIGVAFCWLVIVICYILVINPSAESGLFTGEISAGIFCFLFLVGGMTASAPKMIRNARELNDAWRKEGL